MDPDLAAAAASLRKLEPVFHTPATLPPSVKPTDLLAPEFFEVGASGRRYARDEVIGVMADRVTRGEPELLEPVDFACTRVTQDVFLATYRLRQKERWTWRNSLWRREGGAWKLVYHQGTIIL